MQGGHCFSEGDGGIETVDLKEVDVGGLEAGKGGVDGGEDGLAGEAWTVRGLVVWKEMWRVEDWGYRIG